jgi:ankyrin repeat protein
MWAGWSDRAKALQVLIDAGANVNAKSDEGKTALMIAASRFFQNEVKVLLGAKADVNVKDKNGWNALMFAAFSGFRKDEFGAHGDGMIVWLKATKIIEDLISSGIDANAQNNVGETALMLAVKAGTAHFAETLLANGAHPSIKDKKGRTAKDYADKNYNERRDFILKLLGRIK